MRRALLLGALLLASACDFDEALSAYCAGNPRCPVDAGGGTDAGATDAGATDAGESRTDGGVVDPQDVLFTVRAAQRTSLAGELVPLIVETSLVDGGLLPPGASLTAMGGRAARVISADGGEGPWAAEVPLFLGPRLTPDTNFLEMYETIVRATLVLPGGAPVQSAPFVHTIRARAHVEGTYATESGRQYSPFSCVGFNVVMQGVTGQRVAVDAGTAFVTVYRVDAGSPVLVFPNGSCLGSEVSSLVLPDARERIAVSLRTANDEAFIATVSAPEYFDPTLYPVRFIPLPVEVAAGIDGLVFSSSGAATTLGRDGGGSFTDCTPVDLWWRHTDPRYAGLALSSAVGDLYPYTLSGSFGLYADPVCTASLPLPHTAWSSGGTDAGVTVYLKDTDGLAGTGVTISFPDGGAVTRFSIP